MSTKQFKKSTTMPPLHEFALVTTGNLKEEKVAGITITRSEFVACVDAVTDDPEIIDLIAGTLATIDRFPIGSWMTDRGCGCIVGEMVVAADLIKREAAVGNLNEYGVRDLLVAEHGEGLGNALVTFGERIDSRVCEYIADNFGWKNWPTPDAYYTYYPKVVFIQEDAA